MNDNGNYEIQKDMPSKEEGYRLDTKTSYCGVNGEKDSSITVSMTNDWIVQVKGMTTSRTKCNLYFKKGENFVEYIPKLPTQEENGGVSGLYLIDHSSADITWEGTTEQVNNLKKEERRYAGVNYTDGSTDYVHNYVNIDGQVWRVIGLVNTPEGQRIKLVKDESIGSYSWDSSASNVNDGYGVNEWSKSDLMKVLNEGFDANDLEDTNGIEQIGKYVNNSLYWNSKDGFCYNVNGNTSISCCFTDKGIPDILKKMIETITWNTGSNDGDYMSVGTVLKFYEYERSNRIGQLCDSDSICNMQEEKTSWKGKVGLIYPSDYGYATIGNKMTTTRNHCLNDYTIYNWSNYEDCYNNNWLHFNTWEWTLTPFAFVLNRYVFATTPNGTISDFSAVNAFDIHPTVYLLPSVLLVTGDGSFDNMFRLSL